MNLPNKLTVLRICMIPFFVAALLYEGGASQNMRILADVLFIAASLTDLLDGKIARKYNLVTNFGKFMDPLADKLLNRAGPASGLGGDYHYQPGIYHQRIPPGGCGQRHCDCGQLLGEI